MAERKTTTRQTGARKATGPKGTTPRKDTPANAKATQKSTGTKKAATKASQTGKNKAAKRTKPNKSETGRKEAGHIETGHMIPPIVKRSAYWAAVAGVWGLIIATLGLILIATDLPDLEAPPPPGAGVSTLSIRTADGTEITQSGPKYGDQLRYNEIPDVLVQAFLAIEDRDFFDHIGIDPKGVARAALNNLKSGRISGGGSTITQQLAKNLFLSFEQTFTRKGQELLLAFWLEQKYSKEEILALYLNRIYFGGGAYGIDAASRRFFGHTARTLTVQEAAILAGIVRAPGRYAPHLNPERSWARAQTVLAAMENVGLITPIARARLSETPPSLVASTGNRHMGYFADYVRRKAISMVGFHENLIIYTTIDASLQRAAHASLEGQLQAQQTVKGASQAALVSLDTGGAIKALVGGRDYQKSQYNRATEAVRQPGSAFKLFSYLAALERGAKPTDIENDTAFSIDGWSPKNYSGRNYGRMSLRDAFAKSINTIAVTVAERAGRDRVANMAKRLGITTPVQPIASLPLGTEEVRLIDLAAAYASVSNGGFKAEPYAILEIHDANGALLYRKAPRPKRAVLNHEIVEEMTGMLRSVITDGSGKRAAIDRPAGGKSGTTQDNRDALFVGFTADYVTAVWTGNDDNSAMAGVTGSGLPALIWRDYNIAAHVGKSPRPLLADAGLFAARASQDKADFPPKKKKKSLLERLFGGSN